MDQYSVKLFNKNYFLIIIWVCLNHFKISNSQWNFNPPTPDRPETLLPCHVPTGRASFCVPIDRCKQLSGLIKNLQKPIPGDVGKYIKDSFFCPSKNKVCCPFNSIINPKPATRPLIRNRGKKGYVIWNIYIYIYIYIILLLCVFYILKWNVTNLFR